jgi:hypothetical protein
MSGEPLPSLGVVPWSQSDTRAWLTKYPLPVDFEWKDRDGVTRAVLPSHRHNTLKGGYGKWLAETPYFPGLFELAHDILLRAPTDVVLNGKWLAAQLKAYRPPEQQTFL